MAAAKSLAIAKHAAPAYSEGAAKKSGEEIETVPQTVIDVLTAEDVAEVLQRISGVSISREFGEGQSVSIRDTALRAASTS